MKASIRLIGPDYARIQPGRISLGRFCREAAPLGVRKRFPRWRGWAQPLLPDCEGLHPRCEGGLHGPAGAPSLRFQVDGQHVTIIATGHRPVTLPAPALSLMATVLLSALAKAKALVDQFRVALGKAMAHGDRAIRGAALQVQRLLRHGGPGLTPGLLRRVWEAVPAPFGRACMAVAARTRTNPGRVRYILNFYAEWWKMRTASSPHWVKGLEIMLGLSTPELIRVSNANKWCNLYAVLNVYIYVSIYSDFKRNPGGLTGVYRYIVGGRGNSHIRTVHQGGTLSVAPCRSINHPAFGYPDVHANPVTSIQCDPSVPRCRPLT